MELISTFGKRGGISTDSQRARMECVDPGQEARLWIGGEGECGDDCVLDTVIVAFKGYQGRDICVK